ncbi:MAG: TRAP transporter substrate-binding protein [Alphaproteobacteria bacterium]
MKTFLRLAIAGAALAWAGVAAAQTPTTLRIGNWLPGHHLIPKGIIEPWARAVERESNGTLKLEIMPSAIGRPPEYFDFVVNGVVDIGYGVSGHNPGRFTMTQVMDLPFMAPDPWAGAAAAWTTYERYGARYNEHRGARVLGLWVHSEPFIFMRAAPFTSLDDLRGKKIRVGGNVTGRIMQALGAVPVQLPPTEAQQAMASGVADGITFPTESIDFFRITPVIKGATRIPGGLYTDTFWLAINEAKWASLGAEQKRAFEKHSGMAVALLAGWAWTNGDSVGRAALDRNGVQFVQLADADVAKARESLKVLEEEWLAEARKRNLPGDEIIAYARAMAHQYRAAKPVNVP